MAKLGQETAIMYRKEKLLIAIRPNGSCMVKLATGWKKLYPANGGFPAHRERLLSGMGFAQEVK